MHDLDADNVCEVAWKAESGGHEDSAAVVKRLGRGSVKYKGQMPDWMMEAGWIATVSLSVAPES